MSMLALASLRHRRTAFTATFLSALLGAALIGAFATLAQTATGAGVSDADAETLTIMGIVVGGWGSLIVLFSVASLILGIGFCFYTGAVEAWLVDALRATGFEGQLDAIFARGSMVSGAAMLICSVGGGLLGVIDLAFSPEP